MPVSEVIRYEAEVRAYFKANHADLLEEIRSTGKLPDGEKMDAALEAFKATFDTGSVD